jgi:hypothetical protein
MMLVHISSLMMILLMTSPAAVGGVVSGVVSTAAFIGHGRRRGRQWESLGTVRAPVPLDASLSLIRTQLVENDNDDEDDGWGDGDDNDDRSSLATAQQGEQLTANSKEQSRSSTEKRSAPEERDLFIPIFSLVSLAGLFGSYGYEMLRLYSRGELYLPWDHH